MDSKIKVGQYVRFNNRLYEIESIEDETNWLRFKDNETVSAIGPKQFDNCKFGDTPQELIQVGDLVETTLENGKFEVYGFSGGGRLLLLGGKITCPIEVKSIWTKTSVDTYKRQWRK